MGIQEQQYRILLISTFGKFQFDVNYNKYTFLKNICFTYKNVEIVLLIRRISHMIFDKTKTRINDTSNFQMYLV